MIRALASSIDKVTVYRRGARVTRVARVDPVDGATPAEVKIGGLCLGLDDDSVRARIEAHEPGTAPLPVAHQVRVALDVAASDPELLPAEEPELEAARAEVATLERQCSQIERELSRLKKVAPMQRPPGAKGEPPPPSPVDARRALIEFCAERERELWAELHATRTDLDRATRACAKLEDRHRRASSARNPREDELRKALVVSLAGAIGQPFLLVIEYVVPGARWAPVYTVRLDDAMTSAKVAMRAHIAQRTGEDWNHVAMTLSTATAQGWTELPELTSLRIGRRQPSPPGVGWRPPPAGTEDLYRDWDRAFAQADVTTRITREVPVMAAPATALADAAFGFEEETADLSVGAPPPPPAPMAAALPRVVAKMSKRERAPAGKPMAQPPAPVPRAQEPAAIAAPASLLRYGDLRMPPPSATTRGTLTPAARRDRYLDLAADPHTQHINVDAALDRAVHRAHALENKHVPDCELVWSDAFDHAYPADARIDIPSDGDFHSVPLCERAATCTPLYVTVPRESTDVFATADIDNPLDAPLLPGPVDVYLDGHFLLATRLDTTPARARFSLGLGVEQAIKVARNTRFSEESAGLMGGSLVLSHHLELDIRNNLGHPAPLEIRERIPVAEEKDDDVDVRVAKVSPAWEAWEQALDAPGEVPLRGGYRWRITVAAGELAKVFADYEIKISAKHQLAGGNRREA